MKPSELPSTLKRHGLDLLYLVVGEEDYLRDEAISTIRNWKNPRDLGTEEEAIHRPVVIGPWAVSSVGRAPGF